MSKIIRQIGAPKIVRNSVALGSLVKLLDYDLSILLSVIKDYYKGKLVEFNLKAARLGFECISEKLFSLKPRRVNRKMLFLSGNEAIALGAIRAGMKLFAGYPITPATPILHFLANIQKQFDIVVVQSESEIAAINTVIGAWYAGVRAMTATSGPGFSLMTEALGQAAITETPLVLVLVQRHGPSTGLPTHTSQGDLRFVLHASQGEFPRVVIAPGDVSEAFYLTVEGFNIAERYQLPVIIIIDKFLAESYASVEEFDLNKAKVKRGKIIKDEFKGNLYKRFQITDDGISPMALPGTKNAIVKVNTLEHDEEGFTTENPELVKKMIDKRFRKLELLEKELRERELLVRSYGDGKITIICWGSVKGPALEAQKMLKDEGIHTRVLQPIFISPFPSIEIMKVFNESEIVIVVENNRLGQLASLIKENLLLKPHHMLLKYDGQPFYPEEIYDFVMKVIK